MVLEDDANCGAVGEASVGGPGMLSNLVYVTLSTGIGMGSVAGGRLMVGAHGYTGELGHVTVKFYVRVAVLVAVAGRVASRRMSPFRTRHRVSRGRAGTQPNCLLRSSVTDPNTVTAESVIAAAEAGDEGCCAHCRRCRSRC